MIIDISSILKIDGATLNVHFNEVLEDMNTGDSEFVFDKPVLFEGSPANISGVLRLAGDLSTKYAAKCSRCLNAVDVEMKISIKENFINKEKGNDDESYTYEGHFIELDKVLKDNIVLNTPARLVCQEGCKGLCGKCGGNLNVSPCDCKDDEDLDPRMEALKNFFNK